MWMKPVRQMLETQIHTLSLQPVWNQSIWPAILHQLIDKGHHRVIWVLKETSMNGLWPVVRLLLLRTEELVKTFSVLKSTWTWNPCHFVFFAATFRVILWRVHFYIWFSDSYQSLIDMWDLRRNDTSLSQEYLHFHLNEHSAGILPNFSNLNLVHVVDHAVVGWCCEEFPYGRS